MRLVRRVDSTNDINFGAGLSDYAFEVDCVAQNVKTRLQTLKGEWFLDTDAGVPYLQDIMKKPADLRLAQAEIKAVILATDGVESIVSFDMDFNTATRILTIATSITTAYTTDTTTIQAVI